MNIGLGQAVAGAAGAAGMGLFSYNRGNYMMDQKLHFARYTAGCNLAIAQTNMYRQDITDLTSLTCTRMDVYHSIAAMTATILTALFCPGRLGLHTPPPPGWLMGLFMVNLAGTYLWLGLTMWLAMHASLRADSALTHMLTRFVRLPVPAQWMLDRARKFLSSYEEQPLSEAFRLPFTRHQRKGSPGEGPYNESMEFDADAERRARHGHDVPAWYRKEKAVDHGCAVETMMPFGARGTAPEHFEVYREVQNEWWPYDVYSRLSIFLAFMHLTHCWTYMQIGHHLTETRSVFGAACVVLPMSVLQQLILTLDIIPGRGEFPVQRIGPFAQWFAFVAAVLEYKRWFSPGAMTLSFLLVYVSYGIHIVYTLWLLRLCSPDSTKPPEPAEAPGASWWPGSWRLPSAFQHAIWLVAPPKHLEPGQHDLVGELRAASRSTPQPGAWQGLSAEPLSPRSEKRRDVHRALGHQGESPAWFNVKVGLIALLVAWIFLVFGFSFEIANQGTAHPSLLNALGMPNNARDPRYRPAKPGSSEPVEVGTGGAEHGPAVGMKEHAVERRLQALGLGSVSLGLSQEASAAARQEVAARLRDLLPYLYDIAGGQLSSSQEVAAAALTAPKLAAGAPARAGVQWPPLFEPRVLACRAPGSGGGEDAPVAIALSKHGRGAIVTAKAAGGAADVPTELTPFSLEGVAGSGPVIAAAWEEGGLLVATANGATLECPGSGPSNGRWRCQPLPGAKLPISDIGKPFTGTLALGRQSGKAALQAAVVFSGESTVTLLSQGSHEVAPWLPAGEVRTSTPAVGASFTAEGTLLLASADGSVARMHMEDGSLTSAVAAFPSLDGHEWGAACSLPSGAVARLALIRTDSKASEPALFLA